MSQDTLRVAIAQINTAVGDIEGNVKRIVDKIRRARSHGADLVTFPELAVSGYPPEDLLLKPHFIEANRKGLEAVARSTKGITAIVGFIDYDEDVYNAAAIVHNGNIIDVYHKVCLPNYGVFDEMRYFQQGDDPLVFTLGDTPLGVSICEDIWFPGGPVEEECLTQGALVLVNISASPYAISKAAVREKMLATRAADNVASVVFTNMVGGQDELVFDGASLLIDHMGEVRARGLQFDEDLVIADIRPGDARRRRFHDPRLRSERYMVEQERPLFSLAIDSGRKRKPIQQDHRPRLDRIEEIYAALVLGTRDYVIKNRFLSVLVGLSGGIDSALTAAVAVDALGPENVVGVAMPSPYSSKGSLRDARALAKNLGIRLLEIPIAKALTAYRKTFESIDGVLFDGLVEENIQARIRGNILMALSNAHGWIVLATGNKSEMAMGYCTLYGDMAGGFAVLKDVYKTTVYELAAYRNRTAGSDVIPESILTKPPSAELRPGQLDTDSLPPYDVLDPILTAYIEEDRPVVEITTLGFDRATVERVMDSVDRSEYKRRQAPPGVKVTHRAFGKDRRLPITNRFGAGS